jgi:UDP-2,3-diacylglucosamine pyrophosphatase LpxH
MKTLSIGDIHGRSTWQYLTHGGRTEYHFWRTSVDAAGGLDTSEVWDLPLSNYDKIIFVGDYVDSFDLNSVTIKHNLLDIIHLKKTLGDRVVLLLGNHDIQYFIPKKKCSGYRGEMQYDLYDIFTENLDLFTMAYEQDNFLWTHAGVTSPWYRELVKDLNNPNYRFIEVVRERNPVSVAETINLAWELRHPNLFAVDADSGGMSTWGSPLWVRPKTMEVHAFRGLTQIVGHTHFPKLESRLSINGDTIHFIDCLFDSRADGLELTI